MLNWALDFGVEGQWYKGSLKKTWKKQVVEVRMKAGLCQEDALY